MNRIIKIKKIVSLGVLQFFLCCEIIIANSAYISSEVLPDNHFVVSNLIFSEIHYRPLENGSENTNFEYIEIYNTGITDVDLSGYSFTSGIVFTFRDGSNILAGEYIIIAKNADYYESEGIKIYEWTSGSLNNNGEQLIISNREGINVLGIIYSSDSPWPVLPETSNYSIELNNISALYTDPNEWRLSDDLGGSPGKPNIQSIITDIYINEFVARYGEVYPDEHGNFSDWIEIYNGSESEIDIGGLYMTDDLDIPGFFQIPDDSPGLTTISSGGFLVLRADNNPPAGVLHLGFNLNSGGQDIGIAQDFNGSLVYLDNLEYPAQSLEVSYGRYPDGGSTFEFFVTPTPGEQNFRLVELDIGDLFINEFVASYGTSFTDEHGNYTDWIEIYNASDESIDMAGLYMSDKNDIPLKYQIPIGNPESTTIEPKSYLVLFADEKPDLGVRHLNFRLSGGGEHISLVQQLSNDINVLDQLTFDAQTTDVSYGRYPDGTENFEFFETPTPGEQNFKLVELETGDLYINEFVASYGSSFPDEHGNFSDWIEIYNASDETIDIAGLYMSDNNDIPLKYKIPMGNPDLTAIEPKSYLVLFADANPDLGVRHLNFQLSGGGEQISIVQQISNDITVIDQITYEAQTTDVSYGRYPDGGSNFEFFTTPTPGEQNFKLVELETGDLAINEFVADYGTFYADEHGNFSDWIEIYNASDEIIDIGGLYMSDKDNIPLKYQIPMGNADSTIIEPNSYLVLFADENPDLGVRHLNFQLSGGGEHISIVQHISGSVNVIDQITYDVQTTDISYGRYPDGTGNFEFFATPTPGEQNVKPADLEIGDLYINEFVADYGTFYPDEHGNFSDWIEIYNATDETIDIGGLYMSDKNDIPRKYQIPMGNPDSTIIKSRSYLVLFADEKPNLGVRHLNFTLSGGGEHISLVQNISNNVNYIDQITYEVQTTDISYGRVRDGAPEWQFFEQPSPGSRNLGTGSPVDDIYYESDFNMTLYPNPFIEGLNIGLVLKNASKLNIVITDISGKIIETGLNTSEFFMPGSYNFFWSCQEKNNKELTQGIYFIKVTGNDFSIVKKALLIK